MLLQCNYTICQQVITETRQDFLPYFSRNHKIGPSNDMYVLVASDGVLRNLRTGPTANLEQAKNRSEETAQKHICPRPSHCLHFTGSNSNKQYNWLPIVLLLFKQTMTSGTRDSMKYVRRGEEGVRACDPGPSENQARSSIAAGNFFWRCWFSIGNEVQLLSREPVRISNC